MLTPFTIDDLIKVAPPPQLPVDAGEPKQWDEVEHALGTVLPADYKALINTYGLGEFNDLFFLFTPFSSSERMNLLWHAGVPDCFTEDEELGRLYPPDSVLEKYQLSRAENPDLLPFLPFPEPCGLLPLGGNTNGGLAYWQMKGKANDWPLILIPRGFEPIEQHAMPVVEFLARWLSGGLPDCFNGAGKHFANRTDPVFQPVERTGMSR